jgi:hypothetical protein
VPFMIATADKLIPIQYISFSSWGTTVAKWFYDCPAANCKSTLEYITFNKTRTMTIEISPIFLIKSSNFSLFTIENGTVSIH